MTLDTPIKRGDQTITRVQVRKPNAGALRGLGNAPGQALEDEAIFGKILAAGNG